MYVDLLLIGEEGIMHCVLIKDLNTFTHFHTLHRGRKHFCWYTAENLKSHVNDCFKINGKQVIKMPKASFMIYVDFESILLPENNGKQNPGESYKKKYQKHVACSYGYELVSIDYKSSKTFESSLGEDAVYSFIDNMLEERKYLNDLMKKHFHKELAMTKEDEEDFESSTKSQFVIMIMLTAMLK